MNELINSKLIIILIGIIPLIFGLLKKRAFFLKIFLPSEVLVILAGYIIKKTTAIPRPFWQQPQVLGVVSNIPKDYSFPSFHTALATLFAWIFSYIYPALSWLWFSIMFIIAYSRIKLGLHYPRDIFGGFLVATVAFWLFYLITHRQRALNQRENPNVRRKIVHFFYGLFLVFLIEYNFLNRGLFLFWTGLLLLLTLLSPFLPQKIRGFILYFERDQKSRFLAIGPLLFTTSSLVSLFIFPKNIAMVAILNLAIGDSINALVGSFGKETKQKRLTASFAAYLAATLIAIQYVPLKISAISNLATFLFEFSEPKIGGKKIDDNLLIPIISGATILLVAKF